MYIISMSKKLGETIFALSTPSGQSAVAVIRISGSKALNIAKKISNVKKFEPRKAIFSKILDFEGNTIDSGLVIYFKSPKSFTGEDLIEIQSHGSMAVTSKILHELSKFKNTRPANPGEFSMRAYRNNKQNLLYYEGLNNLISAETETQRIVASRQTFGNSENILRKWRDQLLENIAILDAEIDFSEDQNDYNLDKVKNSLKFINKKMIDTIESSENNQRIISGENILIFGPTNAGKSTLFNFLCQEDLMITSSQMGTTTDQSSKTLNLLGKKVTITDSAGLRISKNLIEKKGIRKTQESLNINKYFILVLSSDSYTNKNAEILEKILIDLTEKNIIIIFNKIDLDGFEKKKDNWFKKIEGLKKFKTLKVSLLKNKTNSNLLTKISKFIDKELIKLDLLNTENFFFSERRQIHIIEQTRKYLNHALENFDEIEIACNYLNSAVKKLDELYGRNDPENKLGLIFNKFCIGK